MRVVHGARLLDSCVLNSSNLAINAIRRRDLGHVWIGTSLHSVFLVMPEWRFHRLRQSGSRVASESTAFDTN